MSDDDLTYRPLTTGDAAAWARLSLVTTRADGLDNPMSEEELEDDLAVSWAQLDRRSRAAITPDGELAGVVWVEARPAAPRVDVWLDVLPERRGELDRELLAWAVEVGRADHAAGRLGADVLEVQAQEAEAGRARLLESTGFAPVRRWHELRRDLAADLPDVTTPAGVSIGPWDDARSEAVRAAHVTAFRDHWGSGPPSDEEWQHLTRGTRARSDLHRIALAGDAVVGYLLAGAYPQDWELSGVRDAWVMSLGTDPGWRGRGIASALLVEVLTAMRADGLTHASLGVDTGNATGAPRLYESLGFTPVRTTVSWHLPLA